MSNRGIAPPVLAISFGPVLGDISVGLRIAPPTSWDAARTPVEGFGSGLSFHTASDLVTESAWIARNRRFWERFALTKAPSKADVPVGYRTAFDDLTLDDILASDDTHPLPIPRAASAPHRVAAALLVAWEADCGDGSVELDAPEVVAVVSKAREQAASPAETTELEIVLALLESGATLPVSLVAFVARVLARAGMLDRAELALGEPRDADALLLGADLLDARGEREKAKERAAAAVARDVAVLGGVERIDRWRRATLGRGVRPNISVSLTGASWRVSFQPRAILGRVDADVVVAAPVVSRRQLELFQSNGVPRLADARSKHVSKVDGMPLYGEMEIARTIELTIGDSVHCTLRPDQEGQLVVEAPSGQHLLAFGPIARLGPWILFRTGRILTISSAECFVRCRGEAQWRERVEVHPDDVVEAEDGGELVIHRESFDV